MRSKQTGVTLIGWVVLLIPMAVCIYTGIRLLPVYLNYMKVARTLEQVKAEFKGASDPGSGQAIRSAIEKHFGIEDVDYPDFRDIKIARGDSGWVVSATYNDQAPLFANMFILIAFDKQVTIGGGGP